MTDEQVRDQIVETLERVQHAWAWLEDPEHFRSLCCCPIGWHLVDKRPHRTLADLVEAQLDAEAKQLRVALESGEREEEEG